MRRVLAFVLAAIVTFCTVSSAFAVEPIKIARDDVALDLSGAVEIYRNQGENFQVSTAPGPDGIVRRIEVEAKDARSTGDWAVFALANSTDFPYGFNERNEWIREGNGPTRLAQNCSGKHASMASVCVVNGWPVEGYLHPEHPLQVLVRDTITDLTGEEPAAVSTDGCGTPLFAHSLHAMARAYGRLAPRCRPMCNSSSRRRRKTVRKARATRESGRWVG